MGGLVKIDEEDRGTDDDMSILCDTSETPSVRDYFTRDFHMMLNVTSAKLGRRSFSDQNVDNIVLVDYSTSTSASSLPGTHSKKQN
jgi:hypothetical protein